ncbi:hypothetical protein MYU51_019779 [Penicillium brevicompactum]
MLPQAIFTTITLPPNNQHILARKFLLLSPSQPLRQSRNPPTILNSYHHFLQHPMDRQALALDLRNLVRHLVREAEEGFVVGEAIMIKDEEDPKIDLKQSMPYQIALRGYYFWKFPEAVLKGVVEFDRLEREKKARKERGEPEEPPKRQSPKPETAPVDSNAATEQTEEPRNPGYDDDEYEEVEVTDSEGEEGQPSKRTRTESVGDEDQPLEFTEEDMEYQLAAMGEDYGLDPGEYGEVGEEDWEEGAAGLPLTEADAEALFRDLLDDFQINPFTPWENIIEEGHIINDTRYTAPSNMKARREIFANWTRDRIQLVRDQKAKQQKADPRIKYLEFLQEHATPKLYWPEFKRKYRKEPEMKDSQLGDKDREKFYRDHISRLKQPESTRKSDLSALLKSVPLDLLHKSSDLETLPPAIITDIRYIGLAPKVRNPLIEAYISTLPPPPEVQRSAEELAELDRKRTEREKREKALADREKRVEEEKRKQRGDLLRGKHLLREGEAEVEEAMRVNKDGLRSYMEIDQAGGEEQKPSQ